MRHLGAEGAFGLAGVRAGQQHIEVRAPGLPPYVSGHVDVRAGFDANVEVALPQIDAVVEEVNVTAPAFTPAEEVKTSGFILSSRSISTSAGALQDVSRFTQSLPVRGTGATTSRASVTSRGCSRWSGGSGGCRSGSCWRRV